MLPSLKVSNYEGLNRKLAHIMRKVILNLAVTLDGFIEGPNGEIDWLVRDEKTDFADILADILKDIDVIFYGRVSYEKWGNYFPEDNARQKLKNAYQLLHSKQKYVFSRSKTNDNKAIFINDHVIEQGLTGTNDNRVNREPIHIY